ncbi:MAG: glycosyltransferase family 1 protein [Anaerolineales bacterium]
MHLAYDATALPPQPVGAGNYIIQLLRALVEQSTGARFSVFVQPHQRALLNLPANAPVEFIAVPTMSPAVRLLWEQTRFPQQLMRLQPNLLHSPHYTMPLAAPIPTIVTLHDATFFYYPQYHTRAKRHFFPFIMRLSARRAAALLTVSESTRQDMQRWIAAPPEKTFATPLGVAPDFSPIDDTAILDAAARKYALPPKFILFVGLLEPRKNLPALLRAYTRLAPLAPETALVIVGRTGWMTQAILDQTPAHLHPRIHFTGYVDQADLPAVYNLAGVFVYPSFYEGFGLPVLESLACGTPVITTPISSMPEVAGDAALYVPPQDDAALSEAILRILNDPNLAQTLRARGLERAATFTWQRTAQQTLQVYRRVLAHTKPANE